MHIGVYKIHIAHAILFISFEPNEWTSVKNVSAQAQSWRDTISTQYDEYLDHTQHILLLLLFTVSLSSFNVQLFRLSEIPSHNRILFRFCLLLLHFTKRCNVRNLIFFGVYVYFVWYRWTMKNTILPFVNLFVASH